MKNNTQKLTEHQQIEFNNLVEFIGNEEDSHVLSGCAGVGKSYLITEFIKYLSDNDYIFELTATTHKAANVLLKVGDGLKGGTIHSLLNLKPEQCFKTGRTILKQKKPPMLDADIIICDESSMIDDELLGYIAAAGIKILFVGDSYQLPPVFSASSPVFEMPCKQSELKEIMRQALDNPLLATATQFRQVLDGGVFPTIKTATDDKGHGLYYLPRDEFDKELLQHFKSKQYKKDNDYCRFLAWTNNCTRKYNQKIRKHLLGVTDDKPVKGEIYITNSAIVNPKENNRLMLANDDLVEIISVKNCHDYDVKGYTVTIERVAGSQPIELFLPKDWDKAQELLSSAASKANAIQKRVYAGETNLESDRKAAWREFFGLKNTITDIRPAYALTVHKCQGSTFDKVFIDLDDICRNKKALEVARLLYVAMTRPKHKVYITGNYSNWVRKFNANCS